MKTKTYVILLVSVALVLVFYLFSKQTYWPSFHKRFFENLKLKQDKSNNFKVREKINEHKYAEGIIVTSLFGGSSKYAEPLLKNKVYKPENWYIRIYLCPNLLERYKEKFLERDYEIFVMDSPSEGLSGTVWRFLPMEEGIKFLSLDADDFSNETSLLMILPTKDLFNKWEKNSKPFLFFASSPCSPIMAGKWGAHYKFPNLTNLLERYDFTERGADELLLRKRIYPIAKKKGYLRVSKAVENLWLFSLFEGYNGTKCFKS